MKNKKHLPTFELARALKIDFSPSPIVSVDIQKVDMFSEQIKLRKDFSEYQREK